jgi:hypothetical protein
MTLDSAVKAVPRNRDLKVREGSPSSRGDTMKFETSTPFVG